MSNDMMREAPAQQVQEGFRRLLRRAAEVISDHADDWDARALHLAIQESLAAAPSAPTVPSDSSKWSQHVLPEGVQDNLDGLRIFSGQCACKETAEFITKTADAIEAGLAAWLAAKMPEGQE